MTATPTTDARRSVLAAVLSDGDLSQAIRTAASARTLGAEVVIFERQLDVPPATLLEGVHLRTAEWRDGDAVERALSAVDADWVLVLGAGETLATSDPAAARRELASIPRGAVGLRVGDQAEVRLHPPAAGLGDAIGAPTDTALRSVDVVPATPVVADPGCDARPITELRDAHQGEDIYIVASGPSMDFIDADFFEGKVSIGLNDTFDRFPTTYLVRKEAVGAQEALDSGIPLIVSAHDRGNPLRARTALHGTYYRFEHSFNNDGGAVDLDVIGTDRMVVSWSTITSAINVAAYLGAANVVLCGHDCGRIDGRNNYTGYHDGRHVEIPFDDATYRAWLAQIEQQTIAVRERIRDVYGTRVYSLNPFLNFGLEGHRYER